MLPIPEPLHPAVVHFPIVFMMLLPLIAAAVWLAIWRGSLRPGSWLLVVALGAALLGSAWLAEQSGAREEERVEEVVSEHAIEEHEEGAERFVILSGLALLLLAAGLLPGRAGTAARGLGVLASLGLMLAGWQVGHSGGVLVYEHNAAAAYAGPANPRDLGAEDEEAERSDFDEDDEDDD